MTDNADSTGSSPTQVYIIDSTAEKHNACSHESLVNRSLRYQNLKRLGLDGFNAEVHAYDSPNEGLEALNGCPEPVILCGLTGDRLSDKYAEWSSFSLPVYLAALKQKSPGAKVVVYTGSGFSLDKLAQDGADWYLLKPCNFNRIALTIITAAEGILPEVGRIGLDLETALGNGFKHTLPKIQSTYPGTNASEFADIYLGTVEPMAKVIGEGGEQYGAIVQAARNISISRMCELLDMSGEVGIWGSEANLAAAESIMQVLGARQSETNLTMAGFKFLEDVILGKAEEIRRANKKD